MGPAPSLIANFKGMYRFNLLLKTNDLNTLRNYLRECKVDIDKNITVDINLLIITNHHNKNPCN